MAPSYKLTYFSSRGYAEPIRFILSYGGIEFEDVRIGHDLWPSLKESTPFGQIPILEHEGRKAGQSIAIARYAAKQAKLTGKDDWEDLEIDSIVDTVKDSFSKLSALRHETEEEKLKKLKDNLVKEVFPYYLKKFEELTKKNNGFLAAGRLTWADLYFVSLSEMLPFVVGFDILEQYPNLVALKTQVLNIPSIKKWIETRPKTDYLLIHCIANIDNHTVGKYITSTERNQFQLFLNLGAATISFSIIAPAYKLTYFDGRGVAEPTRFLFKYGNIDFEDVRIKHEDWPKYKEKTPFGQLPFLEHNGKPINQSIAITRYVAKQVKLAGSNDWENLEIDSAVDTVNDLRTKVATAHWEQDEAKKKTLVANVLSETIPYYLSRLDAQVKKNNGYLALGKLTWADIYLVSMAPSFDAFVGNNSFDKYQNLKTLREKVEALPAIKKWIEVRPKSQF